MFLVNFFLHKEPTFAVPSLSRRLTGVNRIHSIDKITVCANTSGQTIRLQRNRSELPAGIVEAQTAENATALRSCTQFGTRDVAVRAKAIKVAETMTTLQRDPTYRMLQAAVSMGAVICPSASGYHLPETGRADFGIK